MEDKGGGGNGTLRTVGGGVNRLSSAMRLSVKVSNRAPPRNAVGGSSRAPITMDKCEGVEKRIVVGDKGGGGNVMLRTAGRGVNGAPTAMRFSVEGGNGAPSRSAVGGGNRAPRTMVECEGGNEGGNVVMTPGRSLVIKTYAK